MPPALKDDFDALAFTGAQITLRDILIDEGIQSAKAGETRAARLEGALAGFDICRSLCSIADFEAAVAGRHAREAEIAMSEAAADDYWRFRYATVQIEFVYERMKVVCGSYGIDGNQSAQAHIHVASLLGRNII